MTHISIKMLKGKTPEQKNLVAYKLKEAVVDAIGCGFENVSVSIEDYTPQQWGYVYENTVTDNPTVHIHQHYDSVELL